MKKSSGNSFLEYIGMNAKGKSAKKRNQGDILDRFLTLKMQNFELLCSGIDKLGSAAHHMSDSANGLLNGRAQRRELKANGEAFRNEVPSVRALSGSLATYFRNKTYLEMLSTFLNGVQTVFNVLDIIYGKSALEQIGIKITKELEAQVGLNAPKKFGKHVHKFVNHSMKDYTSQGDRHLFFLYHPGNNWHPEFEEEAIRRPLGHNFLGTSDSLDAIVTYMRFFRWFLEGSKNPKPAVFHLLMPAYCTTVVKDPLEFPDLGELEIHGEKANAIPYVWLNLPTVDEYPGGITFKSVENLAQHGQKRGTVIQCVCDAAASVAEWCGFIDAEKPLRRLGIEGESDTESISSTTAEYGFR
jgi:hypothetical protein